MSTLVTVNLAAVVEQGAIGPDPYRVSADGRPYVPVGDGGEQREHEAETGGTRGHGDGGG